MNMNLRLQLCVFACVYVREEGTESEKQRQEGKEEKLDAVFQECVKQICQRDAHRVDYTWNESE